MTPTSIDYRTNRKVLRIRITKASRSQLNLTLDQLTLLHREYTAIVDKCNQMFPQEAMSNASKDESYIQTIEALIEVERSRHRLSSIRPIKDEEVANLIASESGSSLLTDFPLDQQSLAPVPRSTIRASDILNFNGNVLDWVPFRRLFEEEVIADPSLRESRKLTLLTKVLQGTALERCMNLIRLGKPLQSVWSNLNDYYNDPNKIDELLTKQIRDITYVHDAYDTVKLEALLSDVRRLNGTCKSLGPAYATRADSLVKEVLWKCGRPLRQKVSCCQTLSELELRLERLHKSAACLDMYEKPKLTNNRSADFARKPHRDYGTVPRPIAAVSITCLFCNSRGHAASDCQANISTEEKRRVVQTNQLCFKCLSAGHRANACPALGSIRCRKCNLHHPTSLHQVRLNVDRPERLPRTVAASSEPSPNPVGAIAINPPQSSVTQLALASSADVSPVSDCPVTGCVIPSIEPNPLLLPLSTDPLIARFEGKASSEISAERPAFMVCLKGRKCVVWLDTCSPLTLIRKSLVNVNNCFRSRLIHLSGFAGGKVTTSSIKVVIELESDAHRIPIEAYVLDELPHCDLIIGTDMLGRISKLDTSHRLKWETIFGDVYYGAVASMVEEVVDEEESPLDMQVTRLPNGRFEASLPFLSDARPLPNFNQALNLIRKLVHRLFQNGSYDQYRAKFFEYVESGQAIEVDDTDGYFVPHHAVIKPDSDTSKLRIVFNASFGKSNLNDLLWKGTVLGLDVFPHLIRARLFRFLAVADLMKAFLQIQIVKNHRKFIRLLWLEKDGQLRQFEMAVLPFGIVSSPAILTQIVNQIISEMKDSQSQAILKNSAYMDDFIFGNSNVRVLKTALGEATSVFESAGFKLHKIRANFMLNTADQSSVVEEDSTSLLGILWHLREDTFSLKWHFPLKSTALTKRIMLSQIGSLFDPLGVADPLKLTLRLLFKKVLPLDWDTLAPSSVESEWNKFISSLSAIPSVRFKRFTEDQRKLHCFADASDVAIGVCVYLGSNFIFGKSLLAPQAKTIVEKELLALVEATKVIGKVQEVLQKSNIRPEVHLYSDSKINLCRLNMSPNQHKLSVARKILKILRFIQLETIHVHHISGSSNPADLFSRPSSVANFLQHQPWTLEQSNLSSLESVSVRVVAAHRAQSAVDPAVIEFLSRLSSFASMVRWVGKLLSWSPKHRPAASFDLSRLVLVRLFQQSCHFSSPMDHFVDDHGLIRFRARDGICPLWIPPKSALAHVLLMEAHRRSKHNGRVLSLAQVSSEFLIGNASRSMKSIINECLICRKRRAEPISVPLGPSFDIISGPFEPFARIAVDGFGPYCLINASKYWGIVVVCLSTRCLRLGILEDLTPSSAARTLQSIFNEVGYPKLVISDNGTNFTPIKTALETSQMDVQWWTSTPLAPWQNGTAERFVKMVKACLVAYDKRCRSLFEVSRRFSDAAAIINARPVLFNERPISAHELCFGRPPRIGASSAPGNPVDLSVVHHQSKEVRNHFSNLLKHHYLQNYRLRPSVNQCDLVVGDYVLVTDKTNRDLWPGGQVEEIMVGRDGVARSARIRFNGSSLWRPVRCLVRIAPGQDVAVRP